MLPSRKASDGMLAAFEAILTVTADRTATFAKATLLVSAKINDTLVINEESFEVIIQKERDCVSVSIYWEEGGYKAYKNLGLFGKMNTKFQETSMKSGFLYLYGDNYKIRIRMP